MRFICLAVLALVAAAGIARPAFAQLSAQQLVDQYAKNNAPGTGRVGNWYQGQGDKGARSDWTVQLSQGTCYWIVSSGVPGMTMALYLWDPAERRVTDMKSKDNQAMVTHCPAATGTYHVQAKVESGSGAYAMAVYAKGAPAAAAPAPAPVMSYDYKSEMDNTAAATAPGTKLQGLLAGNASSGDFADFPVSLEQGKCYTMIAVGRPKQVEELSIYVWGPNNKRITESHKSSHISSLSHCPTMSGSHKVEVKVSKGKGELALGIYSK